MSTASVRNINEALPKGAPKGWKRINTASIGMDHAAAFIQESLIIVENPDVLRVIASIDEMSGELWLHVSFSRSSRIPNWDDVRLIKDTFIGKDAVAIQIFPREEDYVNRHPNTLHLWSRLDGDTLPSIAPNGVSLTKEFI